MELNGLSAGDVRGGQTQLQRMHMPLGFAVAFYFSAQVFSDSGQDKLTSAEKLISTALPSAWTEPTLSFRLGLPFYCPRPLSPPLSVRGVADTQLHRMP